MLRIVGLQAELEGQAILKGVDMTVNPGEIHVILGPNGSGKSTLGRVILGDEKYEKTAGKVELSGENLEELEPAERAQKGFFLSFQMPPELDGVSAKEFLLAAKKAMDPDFASSFKLKKSLEENLDRVHLGSEFVERDMNKGASGGERRKMEMVTMLTLDPKVAFLDEIDSGIDVDARKAIGESINEFMKQGDKAVILVTHTEKFLEEVPPTHVHILVHGKVVKSAGPELVEYVHQNGFKEWLPKRAGLKVVS